MARPGVPRRLPRLSGHYLARRRADVAALVALGAVLQVAAGIGLADVGGVRAVLHTCARVRPAWLCAMLGAVLISYVGYYLVYAELFRKGSGARLTSRQMRAVVAAGFGGYLAHGASALDVYALEGAGVDERQARVRVASLGGLEHGVLALGGCGAAITVLLLGFSAPPLSFSLPWAVIPVPGFLLAFFLAGRFGARLRQGSGWREPLSVFADSISLIAGFFRRPLRHGAVLGGMALYWAADFFAGWLGIAAFGLHVDGAAFVVAFATGMVFSRRTGPLAGAGVLTCTLTVCVWYSGAPFVPTLCGIFAYRFLTFWLPLPFSLASLPTLRAIGAWRTASAPGRARSAQGEPALEGRSRPG